jgi:hypothetical protein
MAEINVPNVSNVLSFFPQAMGERETNKQRLNLQAGSAIGDALRGLKQGRRDERRVSMQEDQHMATLANLGIDPVEVGQLRDGDMDFDTFFKNSLRRKSALMEPDTKKQKEIMSFAETLRREGKEVDAAGETEQDIANAEKMMKFMVERGYMTQDEGKEWMGTQLMFKTKYQEGQLAAQEAGTEGVRAGTEQTKAMTKGQELENFIKDSNKDQIISRFAAESEAAVADAKLVKQIKTRLMDDADLLAEFEVAKQELALDKEAAQTDEVRARIENITFTEKVATEQMEIAREQLFLRMEEAAANKDMRSFQMTMQTMQVLEARMQQSTKEILGFLSQADTKGLTSDEIGELVDSHFAWMSGVTGGGENTRDRLDRLNKRVKELSGRAQHRTEQANKAADEKRS